MIKRLLVANRGEIALRIQRTARRMGIATVAVYSEADRDARHVREADAAACLGAAAPRASYLNVAAILDAAQRTGADAVHPGYGFLAENEAFARAVLDAGLVWVGPSPASIRAMGDKAQAKRLVARAGVPVLPGYDGEAQDERTLLAEARQVGLPLMVKAAAGGGGRGMRLVRDAAGLAAALTSARSEAEHAFGDGRLLLERALETARHVEVQVFADAHGACIHLGERDCSVQRRHQKLVEESPSPAVDAALRQRMGAAAIAAARAAGYVGAGTVEFLLDAGGAFWFMEMNTRLQVEHPVTEAITGLDLVEWQLRVAAGEALPLAQDAVRFNGHAIEVRLCAEDPARDFLPQAGRLLRWRPSAELVRVEDALEDGAEIPPHYDSMIAKLIAHGATRDAARARLAAALDRTVALGVVTNKAFLAGVLREADFAAGRATTAYLDTHPVGRGAPAEPLDYAIAAVLLAESGANAAGYGEWTAWSNAPPREMRARLACADAVEDVALAQASGTYLARVGGREHRIAVRSFAPQVARVEIDGASERTLEFARDGEVLHVEIGGRSLRFADVLHAPPARGASGPSDGRLVAPMNGRVVAVHAGSGDAVEAGHALVVLEAMKMEHGLALGTAARVTAVHVVAGAQVSPGQLLLEFEAQAARREAAS